MKKIFILFTTLLFLLSSCTPIDPSNSNQVTQELSWYEVSQEDTLEKKVNIKDDREVFSLIYSTLENIE